MRNSHNAPWWHSPPHFTMSPHPPPLLPTPKEKKKKKCQVQFVAHTPTPWSMVKLPVAGLLKKAKSFPTPTPARRHQLWRATSRSHLNPPWNNTTQTRVAQRAHHWALLYKIRKRIPLVSIWILLSEKKTTEVVNYFFVFLFYFLSMSSYPPPRVGGLSYLVEP